MSSGTSYTELREIGSGSFGIATLVRNDYTGKMYISKEVDTTDMLGYERVEAAKEVAILRMLHHQHIVKYQGFKMSESSITLIMEYADGGDLLGAVRSQAYILDEDKILSSFHEICLAVKYLHSKKICHQDLKPAVNRFYLYIWSNTVNYYFAEYFLDETRGSETW